MEMEGERRVCTASARIGAVSPRPSQRIAPHRTLLTQCANGDTHSDTHKANTGKAVLCMESETRHAPNSKLERLVAKIMECVRSVKC